jgi:hypothetical protein
MAEDDINRLTRESEGCSTERTRCAERLAVLEAGLTDLKRLDRHRLITVGKFHSPVSLPIIALRCFVDPHLHSCLITALIFIFADSSISTSGKTEENSTEDVISQPESSVPTPASED